jgi:hypothetical protein
VLRGGSSGQPGGLLGVVVGRLGEVTGDLVQWPTTGSSQLSPLSLGDLPVQRSQPRGQCSRFVGGDAVAGRPGQ